MDIKIKLNIVKYIAVLSLKKIIKLKNITKTNARIYNSKYKNAIN